MKVLTFDETRGSKCLVFDRGPAPWDLRKNGARKALVSSHCTKVHPSRLQTISATGFTLIPTLILLLAVALLGSATAQWITLSARSIHSDRQQQIAYHAAMAALDDAVRDVLRTTGEAPERIALLQSLESAASWPHEGCGSVGLQGLCAHLNTEQAVFSLTHGAGNSATGIDWLDPDASVVFGTFTSARYPSGAGAQAAMPPRYRIQRVIVPTQDQLSNTTPSYRITALGTGPAPARITVLLQADFELITGPPPSQEPDTSTAATSPQLRQLSFRQLPGPALTSDE